MTLKDIQQIVVDRIIPEEEEVIGGKVEIMDTEYVEYPWGWLLVLRAIAPNSLANPMFSDYVCTMLVDRETGEYDSAGPMISVGIQRFLKKLGRTPTFDDERPIKGVP